MAFDGLELLSVAIVLGIIAALMSIAFRCFMRLSPRAQRNSIAVTLIVLVSNPLLTYPEHSRYSESLLDIVFGIEKLLFPAFASWVLLAIIAWLAGCKLISRREDQWNQPSVAANASPPRWILAVTVLFITLIATTSFHQNRWQSGRPLAHAVDLPAEPPTYGPLNNFTVDQASPF